MRRTKHGFGLSSNFHMIAGFIDIGESAERCLWRNISSKATIFLVSCPSSKPWPLWGTFWRKSTHKFVPGGGCYLNILMNLDYSILSYFIDYNSSIYCLFLVITAVYCLIWLITGYCYFTDYSSILLSNFIDLQYIRVPSRTALFFVSCTRSAYVRIIRALFFMQTVDVAEFDVVGVLT